MADSAGAIERVFQQERGRILATLIRLLGGDFDRAEDALASALEAALRCANGRATGSRTTRAPG